MGLFGKLLNNAVQGIDNLSKSVSEHCGLRKWRIIAIRCPHPKEEKCKDT